MSKIAKLAWPRLAVVAILAAPASAAAGAGQAAAVPVSAPALAGSAPTAYVTIAGGGLRPSGHTVVPVNTATNKPGQPIKVGRVPGAIAITPNGKTALEKAPPPSRSLRRRQPQVPRWRPGKPGGARR
jgi:hypothetical protein